MWVYGVDFIFLLLNCNNYRVEACALEMGIAHRVVCRDVLCEAKMLLNLIPSSLALFSLFRSICYVFTYRFQTKDQYLLFHNCVTWCFTSPLPLELHIIPIFTCPLLLRSMFYQIDDHQQNIFHVHCRNTQVEVRIKWAGKYLQGSKIHKIRKLLWTVFIYLFFFSTEETGCYGD